MTRDYQLIGKLLEGAFRDMKIPLYINGYIKIMVSATPLCYEGKKEFYDNRFLFILEDYVESLDVELTDQEAYDLAIKKYRQGKSPTSGD